MQKFLDNRSEIGLFIICTGVACLNWKLGVISFGVALLVPDFLSISSRLLAKRK